MVIHQKSIVLSCLVARALHIGIAQWSDDVWHKDLHGLVITSSHGRESIRRNGLVISGGFAAAEFEYHRAPLMLDLPNCSLLVERLDDSNAAFITEALAPAFKGGPTHWLKPIKNRQIDLAEPISMNKSKVGKAVHVSTGRNDVRTTRVLQRNQAGSTP